MMASNEEYIKRNKIILVDDDQNTRIHYAAAIGNMEILSMEINKRKKLDPQNYLGWTPFMMAVRNNQMEAVNLLLENGADAAKNNKYGLNILLISVTTGNLDLVSKILNHLLSGGITRQILQRILSPMSLAIIFGQATIVQYLIEGSFDVNAATPITGLTPSMFAAAVGENKAMKHLLLAKCDLRLKNYLGKTVTDITYEKKKKVCVQIKEKPLAPQIQLTLVDPLPNYAPYMQFQNQKPACVVSRKSSNILTPIFLTTPNLTPVTPIGFMPQIFFPASFNPSDFARFAVPSNNYFN